MSEDLMSPPYPGVGATTDLMYDALRQLREWILHYRDELNELAGQDVIPMPKVIPKKLIYHQQPVFYQFSQWHCLRGLREEWDDLVRRYEDAWDSQYCVRKKIFLVRTATFQLNDAFTQFEVREAHEQREMEQLQQRFAALTEALDEVMTHSGRKKKQRGDDHEEKEAS